MFILEWILPFRMFHRSCPPLQIRLKQITQELKDFGNQIQPIKAALNDKAKKLKKRQQKLQERREQESIRNKKNKHGQKSVKGVKRKKVNKNTIQD